MRFNEYLLTFLCFAAIAAIGCNIQEPIIEPSPEPTPSQTFLTDKKGNGIKPDGWELPKTSAKEKVVSKRVEKYQDGSPVRITVSSYDMEYSEAKRVGFDKPYDPVGRSSVVSRVEEFSVGSGKVYCYAYSLVMYHDGKAVPAMTKVKLCDMDGDGIFELRGNGFRASPVPDWAK